MATTFVWDEATQAMKPVTHVIEQVDAVGVAMVDDISAPQLTQEQLDAMELAEAKRQLEAVKAQLNLKAKPATGKKRGKVGAYDAGADAIMVGAKLPSAWIDELLAKVNSTNKSLALYTAVKNYLGK